MTRVTRRTAIFGAAGIGVAAAIGVPVAAQARGGARGLFDTIAGADAAQPAAVPGRSAWAPLVGTDLAVSGPAGLTHLHLDSVDDLPNTPVGDEDRYSLTFTTPVPVSGIIGFGGVTRDGSVIELFVSPITQRQRTTAQAVIARI